MQSNDIVTTVAIPFFFAEYYVQLRYQPNCYLNHKSTFDTSVTISNGDEMGRVEVGYKKKKKIVTIKID